MKQMRRAEESKRYPAGNFGLTISAADLSCNGNDDIDSQGNYDYHAHAQVYRAARTPLGAKDTQAQQEILQALRRGPRSQKLAGVFVYGRKLR